MLTMLSGQVMSAPSVLALATILFPCRALSEASPPPPGSPSLAAANQLSHLHTRLKRGWIWKQLFVPEEDPTPRVVGQGFYTNHLYLQLKSDYDRGDFSIRYVLSGEGAGDVFQMDEYSGEIRTLRRLDREEKAFYVLQAQAVSRGSGEPVEPQSEFIVKVQDVNDNAPSFQNEPYVASVPEMCPVGTTVVQVTATDADDPLFGNNAKLIYSILQGEPYFSVEAKTGIIVTSWPDMDREARDQYLVLVQVKDMLGLSGGYSASTTVTVSLTDINDNGPMFQHHQYTFSVREDAAVGMTVGRIMAEDGDTGINARMNYSLDDLEESSTFTIHTDPATQEGVVVLAKELKRVIICLPLTTSQVALVMTAKVMQEQPLDYESKRRFVMAAEASNEEQADARYLGDGESRDRTTLKVFVDDVDEAPVFLAPLYEWKVPENAAPGTAVGVVCARDVDAANNPVRYSIDKSSDTGKAFKIDPNNGTVTVANPLDRETANWHNLTAVAEETKQNHLSSSVVVLIKVLDINDNVPRLARDYRPYICEDTQAGEVIQLLSAVDPDEPVEGHHFYFSMVYEKHINPNFTIRDNQDNTAGVVARRSTFTLEDRALYLLPVVVRDSGSPALSSTATLTVTVCRCQPAGHCPSGGVEALALPLGLSLWTLLGLLLGFATLAALSVLMLLLRRHQQKPQEGPPGIAVGVGGGGKEPEELATDVLSQKVLRYGEPPAGGARSPGGSVPPPDPVVPLRPRPRKRERLRREDVAASIRMSLRHSQLGAVVGPDDELFRRFVADRLAEADGDPCVPPHDCLRTYAYEGTGSSAGSLSSIESLELAAPEPKPGTGQPTAPPARSCLVRLSPWCGAAGEETTF